MGLFSRKKESIKEAAPVENRVRLDRDLPQYKIGYFDNTEKAYCNDVLLSMYRTVTQVNSLINYIALKTNDLKIKHYKYFANGKKKWLGETDLQKAIDQLSIQTLITQFLVQGNVFLQKIKTPSFEYPTSFIIQPSNRFFVIPQYSLDQYGLPSTSVDEINNPVKAYRKLKGNGVLLNFDVDEIIHIKDIQANLIGRDFYYGQSRLFAATQSIKVLSGLYSTINTILGAKGALGFISRVSKTGEIDPAMYQDYIFELERRINEDFGTTDDRRAIMATLADLRWNRMNAPIGEYQPVELTSQEFSQLCNQLGGVPDILFNAKSNASYNNMREAKAALYENVIAPIMSLILDEISKQSGLSRNNEWLEVDYDLVPSMQKNKKEQAEGFKAEADYLTILLEKKLITKNFLLETMGLPTVSNEEFNSYGTDEVEAIQRTDN